MAIVHTPRINNTFSLEMRNTYGNCNHQIKKQHNFPQQKRYLKQQQNVSMIKSSPSVVTYTHNFYIPMNDILEIVSQGFSSQATINLK